jgi:hypothetical protein
VSLRQLVAALVATLLGAAVLFGAGAGTAQAATVQVRPELFGMHDSDVTAHLPYGAVRLWDVGTTWADLEPKKDHYEFAHLDKLVTSALARHAKITLVLGSTPGWAATDPEKPSAIWLTTGSSSPPRERADWVDYVTTVAKRYKGRIDSYQIWNEGGLPQFWSGSPARLAKLTAVAYLAVKKADHAAKVVSSAMLPRQPNWRPWSAAYLRALGDLGWPVNVFAIHSYQPDKLANPDGRVVVIKATQALLRSVGAPSRPMWDTEANYTSRRYVWPKQKITGQRAAAWVARAYLDSLRLNVRRTFWYGYNRPVRRLGVTIGWQTAAAHGYASVQSWLVGATFRGCTTRRAATGANVTSCAFSRGAKTSRVLWASANRQTHLSGKGTTVCRLLTGCAKRTAQTLVTTSPALVR